VNVVIHHLQVFSIYNIDTSPEHLREPPDSYIEIVTSDSIRI